MTSAHSLDLLASPRASMRSIFAFPAFKPGQEEALRHVLSGRDTLVVMPTGSGKSLIYQLAALHLPGITLVVSPLIALMKDQVDQMTRRGIPATFVNSSLDAAEQSRRRLDIAAGKHKIILVAPERLRSQTFRETIAQMRISLLVVDEAHCLSQWGHDFRPDYLYIAEARRELSAPVTLALTATATPRVQEDLLHRLDMPKAARLVTGFNRPNLTFEVVSTLTRTARLRYVHEFLRSAGGAGIIYVGTRRDAEEVAMFARDFARDTVGAHAQHYHAGLDAQTRAQVQDAFMAGDLPVVVATNAFGMGIDRPDVRWVMHFNMPGTVEAYYQEVGRAGRDELPARAVLLYSPHDVALHEHFIEHDTPTRQELHAVHAYLTGIRQGSSVLTEVIEQKTGLSDRKARVALEQLASAGVLQMEVLSSGHLHTETRTLKGEALDEIAQQALDHQNYKRHLLEQMIGYAQTEQCRREFILRYFGDHSQPDAPDCCDNCLTRQERARTATSDVLHAASPEAKPIANMTQAERAALIVLDTIATLSYAVGAGKLAQVLKGSSSQEVARLAHNRNFGKFAKLHLSEIESLIEQLAMAGYVTIGGGTHPTLKLTSSGETALDQRQAIQVELLSLSTSAADRQRRMVAMTDTLELTEQVLKKGRSPQQIAAERGLAINTIYSHLSQLIAMRRISVDDVIPAEVQTRVRNAIARVGSAEYLAPIKAQLPEEIDYGAIRCVVEAGKIEQR